MRISLQRLWERIAWSNGKLVTRLTIAKRNIFNAKGTNNNVSNMPNDCKTYSVKESPTKTPSSKKPNSYTQHNKIAKNQNSKY